MQADPKEPIQAIGYVYVYKSCVSANMGIWVATLFCYKALLLLFGTFLAWETRKVNTLDVNRTVKDLKIYKHD